MGNQWNSLAQNPQRFPVGDEPFFATKGLCFGLQIPCACKEISPAHSATSEKKESFRNTVRPPKSSFGGKKGPQGKLACAGTLVHRIAAFAFAFAMAIPRCQWRHRCVVTLGEFLVVLYSIPLWRKEKWKQRRRGDVRDVKHYHGRC